MLKFAKTVFSDLSLITISFLLTNESYERIKKILKKCFSLQEWPLLIDNIARPLVIFDVGANYGQSIDVFKDKYGDSIIIHSFEPDPTCAKYLEMNYPDIFVHKYGLSSCDTVIPLYTPWLRKFALSGLQSTKLDTIYDWLSGRVILKYFTLNISKKNHVFKTLNDFIQVKADLIKIDVQGAELDVLSGGLNYLARHSPALLIEIEFDESLNVFEFLYEIGYKVSTQLSSKDYLFLREI